MNSLASVIRFLRFKLRRFFQQLVHPAGGPAGRTRRRLAVIGAAAGLLTLIASMPHKIATGLTRTCAAEPNLSDMCGRLGVAGVPSAEERLSWKAIPSGDCEALEAFVTRFPGGIYRPKASELLQRRRQVRASRPQITDREVAGYVRQGSTPQAAAAAIATARSAAFSDATSACASFGKIVAGVRLTSLQPQCTAVQGGKVCSADYRAICALSEQFIDRCD